MSTAGDDIDRDAWLDAALRHAPDAEIGPSPRLRAEILRQAHAAAQPRSAWLNPLKWIDPLVARPAIGAGLASVFVATIVVVLWSPWSPAPIDEVASATSDSAASTPIAMAQSPAPEPPPPSAELAREPAKATDARRERVPQRNERAVAKNEVATAPPAPTAPPALRAEEAKSAEVARSRVAADQATAGAAAPAATTATPAAAAPPAAAPRGRPGDLAPLTAPRRGLRTEPDQWSWQRGGNPPEPVNDALRQWLDKLDAATAGRWEVIDADPPGVRALATLTLLREERVHTIVRLESDGVSRRGSVRVRASLDPAVASALAAELRALSP